VYWSARFGPWSARPIRSTNNGASGEAAGVSVICDIYAHGQSILDQADKRRASHGPNLPERFVHEPNKQEGKTR
jgi:hypothetical protein